MLPEDLFFNPVLTALQTTHAHLAITRGEATRYRPEVSPFAALTAHATNALSDLHSLLTVGELIWLPDLKDLDLRDAQLTLAATLPCHQTVLPATGPLPEPDSRIVPLSCENSHDMVALTDIAFPGFFRPRTCEMGHYYGIRDSTTNELIAMGGERFNFPGYSEVSGLCTHPDHRGKGLAALLTAHLVCRHRREGIVSWLHVSASNQNAIDLYSKLGFKIIRTIPLYQVGRA